MYLKRHARHVQKKIAAERSGAAPTKRTLDAIENNRRWIEHYRDLLKARTGESEALSAKHFFPQF